MDQALELKQGLPPLATTHARTNDLRISSSTMGSSDGDMIKHPKGSMISMVSPTKVGLWRGKLGHAVCPSNDNKVGDYVVCSQGKLIQRLSQ